MGLSWSLFPTSPLLRGFETRDSFKMVQRIQIEAIATLLILLNISWGLPEFLNIAGSNWSAYMVTGAILCPNKWAPLGLVSPITFCKDWMATKLSMPPCFQIFASNLKGWQLYHNEQTEGQHHKGSEIRRLQRRPFKDYKKAVNPWGSFASKNLITWWHRWPSG